VRETPRATIRRERILCHMANLLVRCSRVVYNAER